MKTEKIIVYKKHIMLDREEVILVDTGSPVSFHVNGGFELGDKHISCGTSVMGVDSDYLSNQLGRPIQGLIGMDTLCEYDNVVLDYANNQLLLDADVADEHLTPLKSGDIMGVPTIQLQIDGRTARMFVDTGAPVSYISSDFTNGKDNCGMVEDFHPECGEFTTGTYRLPVIVIGQAVEMLFGNLPGLFQQAIGLVGVDGIIGYELFKQYKVMYRHKQLFLVNQ